jgi:hypothetical protein
VLTEEQAYASLEREKHREMQRKVIEQQAYATEPASGGCDALAVPNARNMLLKRAHELRQEAFDLEELARVLPAELQAVSHRANRTLIDLINTKHRLYAG